MHEAALIDDLMRKIAEVAMRENAGRVTAVRVWLGALSHMSAQHFREHFDHAAAGGIAEGAHLSTDQRARHPGREGQAAAAGHAPDPAAVRAREPLDPPERVLFQDLDSGRVAHGP